MSLKSSPTLIIKKVLTNVIISDSIVCRGKHYSQKDYERGAAMGKAGVKFSEVKELLMKDTEFKAEYEKLQPRYDIISQIMEERSKMNISVDKHLQGCSDTRCSFELFKSNVCHRLKNLGDIDFLIETLENDDIRIYYERKWYPECLYLLAMVDYISRENDIELCEEYNDLRNLKLSKTIYPTSVLALCQAVKSDAPKQQALREAIPEFLRFNIVESDVRNII